ncbi:MAG: twin-arginine translocase TatA/TatE family subunit [Rickettsiales bacterium]
MPSIPQLLIVLLIILLLFGAGRLPKIMGDVGKSIRSLREGLKGEDGGKIDGKDETKDNS